MKTVQELADEIRDRAYSENEGDFLNTYADLVRMSRAVELVVEGMKQDATAIVAKAGGKAIANGVAFSVSKTKDKYSFDTDDQWAEYRKRIAEISKESTDRQQYLLTLIGTDAENAPRFEEFGKDYIIGKIQK